MLQAACNSFATLGVLRALAGAAEACSDPSFLLVTQMVSLACLPSPVMKGTSSGDNFLLTTFLVVYPARTTPPNRTMVHGQRPRHCSGRSPGICHRAYQRRFGIVEI